MTLAISSDATSRRSSSESAIASVNTSFAACFMRLLGIEEYA
jgi:hypothetical protein